MTKNLSLLLGGLLLALTACGEADIEGDCQPELGDDPDCLIDGECAAECLLDDSCTGDVTTLDQDDPDCDACLFDGSCDECLYADAPPECECEGPNPPVWCDPFVPATVQSSAIVAYDAENDQGRSFFVETTMGDQEIQPFFTVLVTDERFDTTNNPAYLCQMRADATGTLPAAPVSRELTTQAGLNDTSPDTREYIGYGVTFETGNFTVTDAPEDTSGGRVEGCSSKYVDPAVWGNESTGLQDTVTNGTWEFSWTNMAPVIAELITQPNQDNPDSEYDFFDLYGDGENFIVGGGMAKPEAPTDAATAYYVTYAFDVDDAWKQVANAEDEDAPGVFIPWDEMLPADAETKPATGLYNIRSFNQWGAQYILLDITPSG